MDRIKILAFVAIASFAMAPGAPKAAAQVTVDVGVAPDCPYGYYDYAPYNCVPDGYYGAEWFNGGIFIGAGPWFHGSNDFHGNVDNSFDPQHGYSGPSPKAGDKAAAQRRSPTQFRGNEVRDGRGHTAGDGHGGKA
jgi:hypothetical protein